MIEVAALTILVLVAWGVVAISLVLLKAALWLVLLPVRLLFYELLLPVLFVLKGVLGGVLLLVLAPFLLIAAIVSLVTLAVAVVVPLLPLLFVAFCVWFVLRLARAGEAASPRAAG